MRRIRILLITVLSGWSALAQTTVWTGTVTDYFGVAWNTQPIEMNPALGVASGYTGGPLPSSYRMMRSINGGTLTEVPFQWISGGTCADTTAGDNGCLLVADGLAAKDLRTYTLQSGVAAAASVTNPVQLVSTTLNGLPVWHLFNGRTGVWLPRTQSSPYNLAPVQGVDEADGTVAGVGPNSLGCPNSPSTCNLLYAESAIWNGFLPSLGANVYQAFNPLTGPSGAQAVSLTAFSSLVIESGPLKTTIQLQYVGNRPTYGLASNSMRVTSCGAYNVNGVSIPNTVTFNGGTPVPNTTPDYSGEQVLWYGGTAICQGTAGAALQKNVYYTATYVNGATYTLTLNGASVEICGNNQPGHATDTCSPGNAAELHVFKAGTSSSCSGSDGKALPCADGRRENSPGHITYYVTMYADSKSVLFDEDYDVYNYWYLPLTTAFGGNLPTTARIRAGRSIQSDPRCSFEGSQTPPYYHGFVVASVTPSNGTTAPIITLANSDGLYNGVTHTASEARIIEPGGGSTWPSGTAVIRYLQNWGTSGGATCTATNICVLNSTGTGPDTSATTAWDSGTTYVQVSYAGVAAVVGGHSPAYDGFVDLTTDWFDGKDHPIGTHAGGYNLGTCYAAGTSGQTGQAILVGTYGANPGGWSYLTYNTSQSSSTGPVIGWYTGDSSKMALNAPSVQGYGGAEPGIYTSNYDFIANSTSTLVATINGSKPLCLAVSSTSGITTGETVLGGYIPAGTTVTYVGAGGPQSCAANTITLSQSPVGVTTEAVQIIGSSVSQSAYMVMPNEIPILGCGSNAGRGCSYDGSQPPGMNNYNVHTNWGLWVSTQSDLGSPVYGAPGSAACPSAPCQPAITRDQTSLTGVNLSRLFSYGNLTNANLGPSSAVFPDPPGGWYWWWQTKAQMNQLLALIRGTADGSAYCGSGCDLAHPNGYYTYVKNSSDSANQSILDLWKENTSVTSALSSVGTNLSSMFTYLAQGDGKFESACWMGKLGHCGATTYLPELNAVMMTPQIPGYGAPAMSDQIATAKRYMALWGNLVWDDRFGGISYDVWPGENYGTTNQVLSTIQNRTLYPAVIPSYTVMAQHLADSIFQATNGIQSSELCTGANQGNPHYAITYIAEPYMLYRALIAGHEAGVINQNFTFSSMCHWFGGALWEPTTITPPDPRFDPGPSDPAHGKMRKQWENGNSNPAANSRIGFYAAGFAAENAALSQQLQWWWNSGNSQIWQQYDDTFSPTTPLQAPTLTATQPIPTGGSASILIPGYWSHSRYNFAQPQESMANFINGGFYNLGGHRDFDDGTVSIHALGAPLVIDWTANTNTPTTWGEFAHSRVVWNSELQGAFIGTTCSGSTTWNADGTAGHLPCPMNLYSQPAASTFTAFPYSTRSCATFLLSVGSYAGTAWQRCFLHANLNASYPLFYTADTFPSGNGTADAKTLTWNIMADPTQNVVTPHDPGGIAPGSGATGGNGNARLSNCASAQASAYPSNSTTNSLGTGWQQFNFVGMPWPQHATGGINTDVWISAPAGDAQYIVGEWGHQCTTAREAAEFQKANGVSFTEKQDILRVSSNGSFGTLIAPYRKTETPTRTLSMQSCGTQIVQGSEITCFNDSQMTYTNGTADVLTAWDTVSHTFVGSSGTLSVAGGAQELANNGAGTITWTISDVSWGTRSISLPPGTWVPSMPVHHRSGKYYYYHAGGAQPTQVTITFTQAQAPLRSVTLDYTAPAGATQVRVKFGSSNSYAAIVPCNQTCSIVMEAPLGTWPEQHDYLDANGNVITSSSVRNVAVQ